MALPVSASEPNSESDSESVIEYESAGTVYVYQYQNYVQYGVRIPIPERLLLVSWILVQLLVPPQIRPHTTT
jgi:hypothetical protein